MPQRQRTWRALDRWILLSILATLGGAIVILKLGTFREFVVVDERTLDIRYSVESLWLTPRKELIVIGRDSDNLYILSKSQGDPGLKEKSVVRLESISCNDSEKRTSPAYSIYGNGSQLAIANDGQLCVRSLAPRGLGTPVWSIGLGRPVSVARLALLEDSIVAVLFADGKLEFYSADSGRRGLAGTWLQGAWEMRSKGFTLAVFSFESGDFGTISIRDPDRLDASFGMLPPGIGASLAISPSGNLAIGTVDGKVVLLSQSGHRRFQRIGASERIRALTFVDEQRIVIGSESGHIHILGPDRENEIAAISSGVDFLDYRDGDLVSVGKTAVLSEIASRLSLNESGRLMLGINAAAILFLSYSRLKQRQKSNSRER